MALTAISSGHDDVAVLRTAVGIGVVDAVLLIGLRAVPIASALGVAAAAPIAALFVSAHHNSGGRLLSRGPFADLMASHGCRRFRDARRTMPGRGAGTPLSRMLCGERFGAAADGSPGAAGDYVASTVLLGGCLCDVDLPSIIGWMPREPWAAVLTKEEVDAIRFAMRPAPPVEELLAANLRGEFLVHEPHGEMNLRSYLLVNAPELLVHPALHNEEAGDSLGGRICRAESRRALEWAWTVAFFAALPMVFAWSALAGKMVGGG